MTRKFNKNKIYQLDIEKLSDDGRGLAKLDGKTIFVSGALATEKVIAKRTLYKKDYEYAYIVEILQQAPERIQPKCPVYELCGGCAFQHISSDMQISIKQNWLDSLLTKEKVMPLSWLEPLQDKPWNYRRKARLGVRYVYKKEKVLVGFRERKSSFITATDNCKIMHPIIGEKLDILSECIGKLSIKEHIPQIEVAIAENNTILILRHLEKLSEEDKSILLDYAKLLKITWYTQSGKIDTVKPLLDKANLSYSLPEHNIDINFLANDFTQVNFELNRKMINLSLSLLELKKTDNVVDFFCGIGNFTLPIAKYVNKVVGVELESTLVDRARLNANKNDIKNAYFYQADLFADFNDIDCFIDKKYNKALIDPAKMGAKEIIPILPKLGVKRLIYVSCNPKTFATDAYKLTTLGYKLEKAGVMDMFPQTAHIESIALFLKQ